MLYIDRGTVGGIDVSHEGVSSVVEATVEKLFFSAGGGRAGGLPGSSVVSTVDQLVCPRDMMKTCVIPEAAETGICKYSRRFGGLGDHATSWCASSRPD